MSKEKQCPWCSISPYVRNFVTGFMLGASICYIAVVFDPDSDHLESRHKKTHLTAFKLEEPKVTTPEASMSIKANGGDGK